MICYSWEVIKEIFEIATKKHGEIVYEDNDYTITMDILSNAVHIILLYKGDMVGLLNVGKSNFHGEKYYNIRGINIEHIHRSKGYGSKMYKALIDNAENDIKGLISKNTRRLNKKEIPKIYNNYETEETEEFIIIKI